MISQCTIEMASDSYPQSKEVIGFPVTAMPFERQIALMLIWAKERCSRAVCIANVHMLIEAYQQPDFAAVLRNADLVTPDGMPLVWMLKMLGASDQDRVAGLDVLQALCKMASSEGISIFFLGSQRAILDKMRDRLEKEFPDLAIAGMEPLPYQPLTLEEDRAIVQKVNESGAGITFVALGCPKQETWMAQHKGQINSVMVGLGGAFPVYAGIHKRAPLVVRSMGFEWLYRLVQEPRRLWGRYRSTIPIFIWLACKQLLTSRQTSAQS
ncbi:MAG: WecB/TagA/CpsF family glycosyltransferase [Leptolyngbyaceae cyanobacterium bins.302]|nr:WecB/TagA/CpsF family glycosyltransferase [Leptolyngbyaceae cyanobacterium bins.302]